MLLLEREEKKKKTKLAKKEITLSPIVWRGFPFFWQLCLLVLKTTLMIWMTMPHRTSHDVFLFCYRQAPYLAFSHALSCIDNMEQTANILESHTWILCKIVSHLEHHLLVSSLPKPNMYYPIVSNSNVLHLANWILEWSFINWLKKPICYLASDLMANISIVSHICWNAPW